MKQREKANQGKQTATHYRRSRLEKGIGIALRAVLMLATVVFLTVAVVLVLLRRNWVGLGVGAVGMTLCMIALVRVAAYASDSGFYSRLMDMPADTLYQVEILPTWIVYGLLAALALLQYFSLDAKTARMTKKRQEEAKAPSILENNGN